MLWQPRHPKGREARPSSGQGRSAVSEAGSRGPGLPERHQAPLQRLKAAELSADVMGARARGQGPGAAVWLREKCDVMSQMCSEPTRSEETPPWGTHTIHTPLQDLSERSHGTPPSVRT